MTYSAPPMFDSHCHLTDPAFDADREDVISRARVAGVQRMVTIASDPEDAAHAVLLARDSDSIWATAGLHPHAAAHFDEAARARILALLDEPRVVAMGEAGLDYYYDNAPRAEQRAAFEWQLEVAAARDLPVVVHARSADDDVAAIIGAFAGHVTGVLHCFSSGESLLHAGLDAGWYISFSGLITFKNFAARDLVRAVPADRLLAETDSPYLAPVPHRGQRNEPAHVAEVVAALAAIRAEAAADVAAMTTANALRFYKMEA